MTDLRKVFLDIEANGFKPTKITCLVLKDEATGEVFDYADQKDYTLIEEGVKKLQDYDSVIGHNIKNYDLKVIRKLYPSLPIRCKTVDTLTLTRQRYPKIKTHRQINKDIPQKLWGKHTLTAWGLRLGCPKGDYAQEMREELLALDVLMSEAEIKRRTWNDWNERLHAYCIQDVDTTEKLYRFLTEPRTI